MPTQTISTDLSSLDDNTLLRYATDLSLRFAGNKHYPKPDPSVEQMSGLVKDFGDTLSQSRTGGAGAAARKNEVRQRLEAAVQQWIAYATTTTPGDTVAWLEAGFRLTKGTRDKAQVLPVPTSFTVDISGEVGTARLRQSSQAGTRAYVFGYAPAPAAGQEPVWQWQLCGKPDCLLTGLDSEKPYLFAGGAWNGAQPWPSLAAPVRRVVQ